MEHISGSVKYGF